MGFSLNILFHFIFAFNGNEFVLSPSRFQSQVHLRKQLLFLYCRVFREYKNYLNFISFIQQEKYEIYHE